MNRSLTTPLTHNMNSMVCALRAQVRHPKYRGSLISKRYLGAQSLNIKEVQDRKEVAGRFGKYQEEYNESLRDRRRYWLRAASGKCISY